MNKPGKILIEQFSDLLQAVTENGQEGDFFLESDRAREMAYSMRSVERWYEIVQIIESLSSHKSCLDIGTSPFTFVLPQFFEKVATLDYTDSYRSRCERAGVALYSGGLLEECEPIPQGWDCILFLEVIEHLRLNPVVVLRHLNQMLKPGGTLVLSTPNMMCLGNRIRMLANRKLHHFHYPPFSDNEHPAHGHVHDRIFMPAELEEYLGISGWSRYSVSYHGLRACDVDTGASTIKRVSHLPLHALKAVFPSLRQLILIRAQR